MTAPAELLRRAGLPAGSLGRLSGGDISEVWRAGDWVVKCHPRPPPGLFAAEARSLEALRGAGMRVPDVRLADDDGIVMRWLAPGPDDPVGLAEQLARLHRAPCPAYGWDHPVYLGSFPLPRAPETASWVSCWNKSRLQPLLDATRRALGPLAKAVDRLVERFEPPTEGPCLIHGDLWNGNVLMTADGAALIDPSTWRGERAVDLAMMQLFGGFGPRFWDAYRALAPIPADVERALPYHQLYFVLVHVHLFGRGYLDHVARIVDRLG